MPQSVVTPYGSAPDNNPAFRPTLALMSTDAPAAPVSTLTLRELTDLFRLDEQQIRQGGGKGAIARQHDKNRLTARERIALLVDNPTGQPVPPTGPTNFLELGLSAPTACTKSTAAPLAPVSSPASAPFTAATA